jgi:hypothetical protein
MDKTETTQGSRKKRILAFSLCAVVAIAVAASLLLFRNGAFDTLFAPSLTLMSPAPVSASDRSEIIIDAVLSDLPDRVFPAASISVDFDPNKLEFVGVKQGTMMTLGGAKGNEQTWNIPIWESDAAASNRLGEVNTMYLDMTGGQFAYIREGFQKNDHDILVRLAFRLKDSAIAGDIYHITVKDAVIATVGGAENNTSLATGKQTLKAYPAKIVVEQ